MQGPLDGWMHGCMNGWVISHRQQAKPPRHNSVLEKSPSLPLLVTLRPEKSQVLNTCFWEQSGEEAVMLSAQRGGADVGRGARVKPQADL